MGPIRTTIIAALAFFILPVGTADAQFWPQYSPWWGHHAPSRHRHHHRQPASELAKSAQPRETPKGPLQIVISVADQRVSLYDNGALIERSSVSTGVPRHPTPLGVFSVIDKQRWHSSNLYSAAPMPYMQRITWSGIALHAGVVPGHPASHGCIRLKNGFADRLWHLTKRGARVIIARNDVQPAEITNPHLFKPKAAAALEAPPATVAANSVMAAATAGPLMSNAEVQAASPSPAGVAPKKAVPISVFVSRKSGKLFVRQAFRPLFDVPVNIRNPEEPLGTHVFTAMEFQSEGADIRWNVVSMPDEIAAVRKEPANKDSNRRRFAKKTELLTKQVPEVARPAPSPDKANAALDRIEIPQDAVDRISELLTPASSVIISDHGISQETGKYTDFIVITH
jgi:hypothetical protein